MTPPDPDRLTDRQVLLALQELTEDLTAAAATAATAALDHEEAARLLTAFLHHNGQAATAPLDEAGARAAARRLLATLTEEPACADTAADLLADPPADSRLGGELALTGVVVLAAVVAWLQTKVDIRFKRIDGRTEFEFRLLKQATDGTTLRTLAAAVARLLGAGRD
ncbi:hypothetical protein ACIQF6_34355 [Kitasatospora sp. NPDC092948]|uniref:hypothetical protein n=1 Tax=Kitasatospora sp. NPDC092948 TaxID=3364088 RepID=UPI003815346D